MVISANAHANSISVGTTAPKAHADSPKRTAVVFVLLYYFVFMFCAYRKWSMSTSSDTVMVEPIVKQTIIVPTASKLETLKSSDVASNKVSTFTDNVKPEITESIASPPRQSNEKIVPVVPPVALTQQQLLSTKDTLATKNTVSVEMAVSMSSSSTQLKPASKSIVNVFAGIKGAVQRLHQSIANTFAHVASFFSKLFGGRK